MKLDRVVVKPLFMNCYLLYDNERNTVIFDPGGEADKIIEKIESEKLKPAMILNTHGHFDHIGAVSELKKKYNIEFYLHKNDEELLSHSVSNAALYGVEVSEIPRVDCYLRDGDIIEFGGTTIQVLFTPGHTPGGVCFFIKAIDSVITGDTLFAEAVGRTDFPYGDHSMLIRGIKTKLMSLDDKVKVYPGHDVESTIGHERKYNSYF
jgi:glyoxylase-like metal-dependent hydrolase (beta-lactamase superfamily II)